MAARATDLLKVPEIAEEDSQLACCGTADSFGGGLYEPVGIDQ
jgi:hypothetical protein